MKKELEEMSDRELDREVAIKVFGCIVKATDENGVVYFKDVDIYEGDYPALKIVPRYSSDIAAAWLVVEEMRKHDIYIIIDQQIARDGVYIVYCKRPHKIYFGTWQESGYFSKNESAPRAICIAALKAIQAKGER